MLGIQKIVMEGSSRIVLSMAITSMQDLYMKVGHLPRGSTRRDAFQRKIKQGPLKEVCRLESLWPLGIGVEGHS